MITLPSGPGTSVFFPCEDLWVPAVTVNFNVHILPGIPSLFQKMLPAVFDKHVESSIPFKRRIISTMRMESDIERVLRDIQNLDWVVAADIKIGSYPKWVVGDPVNSGRVHVSVIGKDSDLVDKTVELLMTGVNGTLLT